MPDTSPISINPLPAIVTVQSPVVTFQRQAPKRELPVEQEPCEDAKRIGRCLKLARDAPPFDSKPKDKGLCILDNLNDASPFRPNTPSARVLVVRDKSFSFLGVVAT